MICWSFDLPGMRLVNPTNEHAHWCIRHKRASQQRYAARVATGAYVGHKPAIAVQRGTVRLVVTITRLGKGTLDSDSLPPSAKHVRDGIADALGVDDGDETRVTWQYRQERAREWGVRVEVSEVAP